MRARKVQAGLRFCPPEHPVLQSEETTYITFVRTSMLVGERSVRAKDLLALNAVQTWGPSDYIAGLRMLSQIGLSLEAMVAG